MDTTTEKSLAQIAYESIGQSIPWNRIERGSDTWEGYMRIQQAIEAAGYVKAQPYFVTAVRPPTGADADADGIVLALRSVSERWAFRPWTEVADSPGRFLCWMPTPPIPISADDAAFKQWLAAATFGFKSCESVTREAWKAALAYAATKQPKAE